MKIELTKKEYRAILDLIFIGDWVVNAYKPLDDSGDDVAIHRKAVQKIYSKAKEFGFESLIRYSKETDEYVETSDFEDSNVFERISEFEENMFWEKLILMFAQRDAIIETGPEKMMSLSMDERIKVVSKYEEKWTEEIENNGITRLDVKE